jgi:hypothetical protein
LLRHPAAVEVAKNALRERLHVAHAYRNSALRVTTGQRYGGGDPNECEKRTQNRLTGYKAPTNQVYPTAYRAPGATITMRRMPKHKALP